MLYLVGGFLCQRHDEVRDLIAKLLTEVCGDVRKEPKLQSLSGEQFKYKSATKDDQAALDVSALGFWTRGQRTFFDIRIFDPMAASHFNQNLPSVHKKVEKEKMRKYGERIIGVEQGSFTPLIFSIQGGMSPQTQMFFKRLVDLMVTKKQGTRAFFMSWLRCRMSFSLLRSALLCLRGERTRRVEDISTLAYDEVVMSSKIKN